MGSGVVRVLPWLYPAAELAGLVSRRVATLLALAAACTSCSTDTKPGGRTLWRAVSRYAASVDDFVVHRCGPHSCPRRLRRPAVLRSTASSLVRAPAIAHICLSTFVTVSWDDARTATFPSPLRRCLPLPAKRLLQLSIHGVRSVVAGDTFVRTQGRQADREKPTKLFGTCVSGPGSVERRQSLLRLHCELLFEMLVVACHSLSRVSV